MKIVIADDEAPARSRLVDLVERLGDPFEVVAEAKNGREVVAYCESLKPDIVLLDIRMPTMDGIEAARELAKLAHPPAIIFTTAYEVHALEAFEVSAIDYLLKPIRLKRLETSLNKAVVFSQSRWEKLQEALPIEQVTRSRICVKTGNNLQLIPLSEVEFFRAGEKYVTIFSGGKEYLIEESLKSLEREFSDHFIRVHRNALVACSQIKGLNKNGDGHSFLQLEGVSGEVEVSRRHLPAVRAFIATNMA